MKSWDQVYIDDECSITANKWNIYTDWLNEHFFSRFAMEKTTKPWAKYNSYWDEKTIDVQWHEMKRKKKIQKFKRW